MVFRIKSFRQSREGNRGEIAGLKKYTVLYNPLAGNSTGKEETFALDGILAGNEITYKDITTVEDYRAFFAGLSPEEIVLISGGDGTLNKFVNYIDGIDFKNSIYYYATGSGNDFLGDVGKKRGNDPFEITGYVKNLPSVTVKGKKYRFINNVGFGIDGYCCEEGDRRRKLTDKPINYTSIALKGLAFCFKPVNAEVTVDGVTRKFRKVWLVPTMNGRYYGGGMMIAPDQDRLNEEHSVTVVVVHNISKVKIVAVFPSIFKGKHLKYKKNVDVIKGHEVHVKFDRPCALQIDGETVSGVTEYSVKNSVFAGVS